MTNRCAVATVVVSPEPDKTYALQESKSTAFMVYRNDPRYSPTIASPQLQLAREKMAVGVANGFFRVKAAGNFLDITAISVEKENALVTAITQELTRQEHRVD
ncbi:hypothetical protein PsorP6_001210 [Peronosclerospora sorghi]|uniref:Uncharacterized protein n=1 Tax=Peronosclerospora sorghi TaxID=230839 RepID=A0ACC0WW92_9STRA|nr:hypothetical protein PsorP6_001210 [Peronosclerospora sorghi]